MMKSKHGRLFVISGPSGAGKGTILNNLLPILDDVGSSVSCTTRSPRPNEVDGVDYYFVSEEEFARRKAAGDFLESAGVHGCRYGTLNSEVRKVLERGEDIVLEIDVQGALQVKKKFPDTVTIFITTPTFEELERRLRGRGTESEEKVQDRLTTAKLEMAQKDNYDYVVINDVLEKAVADVAQIIREQQNKDKENS